MKRAMIVHGSFYFYCKRADLFFLNYDKGGCCYFLSPWKILAGISSRQSFRVCFWQLFYPVKKLF